MAATKASITPTTFATSILTDTVNLNESDVFLATIPYNETHAYSPYHASSWSHATAGMTSGRNLAAPM